MFIQYNLGQYISDALGIECFSDGFFDDANGLALQITKIPQVARFPMNIQSGTYSFIIWSRDIDKFEALARLQQVFDYFSIHRAFVLPSIAKNDIMLEQINVQDSDISEAPQFSHDFGTNNFSYYYFSIDLKL